MVATSASSTSSRASAASTPARSYDAELAELERAAVPTVGSCAGQFTANTMAMVAEVMGLALSHVAMTPAVASSRGPLAEHSGRTLARLIHEGGPLPRDLVTRRGLENAAAAVAATGGSTNAALHLPAISSTRRASTSTSGPSPISSRGPRF